jgi:hypothetical protein
MVVASRKKTEFDILTHWDMEARPEELTDIMLDPDVLARWGTTVFMACEAVERGAPDGMGMEIRIHTKGFLPHSFFFGGRVTALEPHRWIEFEVYGDFVGFGRMHVEPAGPGRLTATFRWQIDVAHPMLKPLVRIFHRVFIWNHVWAVRRLSRMMQAEVYRRRARVGEIVEPTPTFPHNLVPFRRWQQRRFASRGWRASPR